MGMNYVNPFNSHLLPLITPEMLTRYPDQTCDILNRLIRNSSNVVETTTGGSSAPGNLEDIRQTTTSYDDGGVNIVTAYLSGGETQDFQIRNGRRGSQGDPGTPGADGRDGQDGQDATVDVGTTTTLPAGSSATVTNTGTASAAVFNFGIPRGADGAPGQAATVTAGTTTTLPAGSSASVTNSGTSSAAVFDFSIPKGDTGAAGQDGADGADGFSPIATVSKVGDTATITITDENGTTTATVTDGANGSPGAAATITAGTTTTLSPGSSATVTNSGTSSAAIFDFGIPQGATGAAGPANTLSIGTVTGGATADATITGTSPNQTLNLVLPKGDTGDTGPKGEPGKGVPVGSIIPFSGSTLPDGYLLCDGSAVSRTTYAELFAVIGTTYGAGDGTTTFNLPNLKGRVTVGQDTSDTSFDVVGETGGEATTKLTIANLPMHAHTYMDGRHAYSQTDSGTSIIASGSGTTGAYGYRTGGAWGDRYESKGDDVLGNMKAEEFSNLPPYLVTTYIIKAKDVAATVADVLNAYSSSTNDVYSADYVNSIIPAVPTVNDATLTIQKNGTSVGTFTANSASNVTANITVPTAVSELNNDSGYLTSVAWNDVTGKPTFASVATSGAYSDLTGTPTIPTKTSELNNDSGFITSVPIASTNSLGGIKVGNNLTIAADGTLSATGGGGGGITIDDVYPVGSIYMSVNSANPSTLFGGTWVQIEDTFLMAAGTNYAGGTTGGSDTHRHKLSNNGFAKIVLKSASKIVYRETDHSAEPWTSNYKNSTGAGSSDTTNEHYGADLGGYTDNTTTLPPYLAVYVWKRTA